MNLSNLYVLTYHKCGSNWFRNIFREIASLHGMNWKVTPYSTAKVNEPIDRGSKQSLIIIRGGAAQALTDAGFSTGAACVRCVRDPRDALISQYWSWKNSHKNNTDEILNARERFRSISQQQALIWLINERKLIMERQINEINPGDFLGLLDLRYEDLLADFHSAMQAALEHLGAPVSAQELESVRVQCSFEKKTHRKPGHEDTSHHLRKGIAGEWKEVFDKELQEAFNSQYGEFLRKLGYV